MTNYITRNIRGPIVVCVGAVKFWGRRTSNDLWLTAKCFWITKKNINSVQVGLQRPWEVCRGTPCGIGWNQNGWCEQMPVNRIVFLTSRKKKRLNGHALPPPPSTVVETQFFCTHNRPPTQSNPLGFGGIMLTWDVKTYKNSSKKGLRWILNFFVLHSAPYLKRTSLMILQRPNCAQIQVSAALRGPWNHRPKKARAPLTGHVFKP